MDTASDKHPEDKIAINDQSLFYCPDGSGEVVTISMRGLSFHHLTGTNWPTGAFKINLLLDNSTLLIEQIPCSLIPQTAVPTDNSNRWHHTLEFGPLSEDQMAKLKEFITNRHGQKPTLTMF